MIRRYLLLGAILLTAQLGFSIDACEEFAPLSHSEFSALNIDTPGTRYLSQIFTGTVQQNDVVYGNNISILTGEAAAQDLVMDVYMPPADDTVTTRPVWVVMHTGTFIPKFFNQSTGGSKTDSTVVEVCTRLAKMGYVAVAATYRAGWLATAQDNDLRLGTLLQAAYRGIQDTRTCIRYLRKSVAEDGNPFGIDAEKVGAFGIGTGGYLTLGAAGLDEPQEVLLPKFLNSTTFEPLADTTVLGNFFATNQTPLNNPNHVGYSSDFDIAVNLGGAIGDSSWIQGKPNEPAIVGFHATGDIFAPFGVENVFEPVRNLLVIDQGSGARIMVDKANQLGNNDVLNDIPAECDPLADKIQAFKDVDHTTIESQQTLKLGTDHFYPFVTNFADGAPWNWWGLEDLQVNITGLNAVLGDDIFNADSLHATGLLTNPTMSSERGNTYLDTVFMVLAPRAYYALGLAEDSVSTSVPLLSQAEVELKVSPVPSNGRLELQSAVSSPMQHLRVLDISGRTVAQKLNINATRYTLTHNDLPPGTYVLDVYFKTGRVAKKVVFK